MIFLGSRSPGMESSSCHVLGTPKRVVLGPVDNHNNGSPISPMANLKLLTKVATSYMDENSTHLVSYPYKIKKTPVKNQRQLRSLGYICKKFLGLYNLNIPMGHSKQISLGNLTLLLDIEKRRVYDIINIIASLRYASKVCKDKYSWFGDQYLVTTLCELRNLAFSRNYHLHLQKCFNNNTLLDIYDHNQNAGGNFDNDERQIFDDNRIGALCQKSMMLFLIAPKGEPLNFRIISQIILPQDVQDKTGMRRLYDISNVLESLGLIKRCDSKHMKRPTFIYSGPELPTETSDSLPVPQTRLTDIEHLSDTSLDGSDSRISSNILDIVSTEFQELEKMNSKFNEPQLSTISAKKQLFPESTKSENGFIKAPQSSFKFTSAGLVKVNTDENIHQYLKLETQAVLTPAFSRLSDVNSNVHSQFNLSQGIDGKKHGSLIRINKIARPVNVYKISSTQNSSIQNGGIYRVVKKGNIINLVQIKSAQ